MKQQLKQRLKVLRAEDVAGQKGFCELENKQATLRITLLQINSAIQVLEEELSKETIIEQTRIKKTVY